MQQAGGAAGGGTTKTALRFRQASALAEWHRASWLAVVAAAVVIEHVVAHGEPATCPALSAAAPQPE